MKNSSPYRGIGEDLVTEIEAVLRMIPRGLHASVQRGEGVTYVGLKDFEDGDQLKDVDISRSIERSPKLNDLVIRLFEPEKQIRVVIVVDCTRGAEIPRKKAELARALIWLFALSGLRRRDQVEIHLVFDGNERGIISSGKCQSVDDVNVFFRRVLAGDAVAFPDEIATFIDVLGGRLPDDSFVAVISDFERGAFAEDGFERLLVSSRSAKLLLAVLDGWEGVESPRALVAVAQGGGVREIDGRPGRELDGLRSETRRRQKALIGSARESGHLAVRIPVLSQYPFDELVQVLSPE